jgi:hypothetical protein
MRGVTRPVSFPAVIARKSDGTCAALALIDIEKKKTRRSSKVSNRVEQIYRASW